MPYNPQRDRILRTYRFPRPTSLHNTITETFAHLIGIRTVCPVNLDTTAYRNETKHIIPVNRITTFSQLEFQPFQILIDYQNIFLRRRFLLLRSLQVIPFGTAIHNFIVRITVPLLLLHILIQNLVNVQSTVGNPLIKLRHILEAQTLDEAHHGRFIIFQLTILEFPFQRLLGKSVLACHHLFESLPYLGARFGSRHDVQPVLLRRLGV